MGQKCCRCCKKKEGGDQGQGQQPPHPQPQPQKKRRGCCKKCCRSCRKCKCCSVFCWLNWIVIIVGVVLLLMYTLWKCEIYRVINTSEQDVYIYWLTFTAILFPTVSAVVFMIFTKCGSRCCCCCVWLTLWLLIHVGFSTYTIYTNNDDHLHSSDQIKNELDKSLKSSGQLPKWFQNTQGRNSCCGVDSPDDFDDVLFPKSLLANCTPGVKTGCKAYLDRYYHECLVDSITFVCIMMFLGIVSLVVYVVSYRERMRVQAIEEANKRWLERRRRRSRSRSQSGSFQEEQDDAANANSQDPEGGGTTARSRSPSPANAKAKRTQTPPPAPGPTVKELSVDLQENENEFDDNPWLRSASPRRGRRSSPHYIHRNPYNV